MTIKKISPAQPPHPFEAYTRIISPLPPEEGGGFLVTFPDLPGCMADGDTEQEALTNGKDAFLAWVAARTDQGKTIPAPRTRPEDFITPEASGRLLARLPKSLHARLIERARQESVSINSLLLSFVAAGLAQK
ncbi:MAG: hypothetical protein OZSIB_0187 [Candidatus Ozemobacter sibiricus]|uniref:HicB-like antitoxin of toxin-antitoxin system domain-containing protein n=1 Tax=Candidatus Ozemobacter sibiricus TaxID=2268124 RepID=A0A367ZMR3_9BACT|nr:MAG: hypothetical protein OZSIB_0187 [Candidatus Ozemobacter sibiricus]